jgi:hypothetical protein
MYTFFWQVLLLIICILGNITTGYTLGFSAIYLPQAETETHPTILQSSTIGGKHLIFAESVGI